MPCIWVFLVNTGFQSTKLFMHTWYLLVVLILDVGERYSILWFQLKHLFVVGLRYSINESLIVVSLTLAVAQEFTERVVVIALSLINPEKEAINSFIWVVVTNSNCSIAVLDFNFSSLRELTSDLDWDSNDSIFLQDASSLHSKPTAIECNISRLALTSCFVGLIWKWRARGAFNDARTAL